MIPPGTLCIVVGACCARTERVLGRVVMVTESRGVQLTTCPGCGRRDEGLAVVTEDCEWDEGYLERWLKPLPPLNETLAHDHEVEA